jgi:hypothetical protein
MRTKYVCLCALVTLAVGASAHAQSPEVKQTRAIIKDAAAKKRLLGPHRLSLQWISWDYFGKAVVTESKGVLKISGEQKGRGNDDYLKVNGIITMVDTHEIKFDGTIITKVSHINGGKPCTREGEMTFRITQNRKYWRLKEMDNPCDPVTDYVDIFFR